MSVKIYQSKERFDIHAFIKSGIKKSNALWDAFSLCATTVPIAFDKGFRKRRNYSCWRSALYASARSKRNDVSSPVKAAHFFELQKDCMPRLDNLAFVSTFPKDYLPYVQQKRKTDPMESNTHWKYKRKWPFIKCCDLSSATTIISIAVTILAFLAALGVSIYFGVLTTMYTSPVFHIYGKIRVTDGDEFDPSLSDAGSENFINKAGIYENKIRSTYLRSLFQYVLHEVRIYGFRGPGLNVFFRLHLDRRKGSKIKGVNNLAKTVLLNEIQNGVIFDGLSIDPESVSFSDASCIDNCPTQPPATREPNLTASDWLNTIDVTTEEYRLDHSKEINVTKNSETSPQDNSTEVINVTNFKDDSNSSTSSSQDVTESSNATLSAKFNTTEVTVNSPKLVSQFTRLQENGLVYQEVDNQNWNESEAKDDLIVPVSDNSIGSTTDFENVDTEDVEYGFPECGKDGFRCDSKKCIPGFRRCDRFSDCSDNSDETNCSCADYLKSIDQPKKICDGFIDCWDYSDEIQCPWCSEGMFQCPGAKQCIEKTKVCDGVRDCTSGSDEAVCMKLAKDERLANGFSFVEEGYLMIQREGLWKKLCLDNNDVTQKPRWNVQQLGHTVCSSLTYKNLESIVLSPREFKESSYYELVPATEKSSTTFHTSECTDGKIARIKCGNLECGLGSSIQSPTKRIVGGGSVGLAARPWLAALYREGQFQCGAVIIADRWLLSAGHCFFHTRRSHWVARMGLLRRGSDIPTPYEEARRIIHIEVNPQYINKNFINDIAVLKLENSVPFSNYIRPICLPRPEDDVTKWHGKKCSVVGWGKLGEHGDIFPDTLQEVQLPVISTEECRKRTLFLPIYQITDNMFCAGFERGGRDACLGDSGGPMMCQKEDGRWVLIGIISNGDGCARASRPGVYTKVGNFVKWIRSVIDDNITGEAKPDPCIGTRCRLGTCLSPEANCDGNLDCWDGSDERGC